MAVRPDGLAAGSPGSPGTFELEGDSLYFTPRFPFGGGTRYVVVADGEIWPLDRPPRASLPTTEVAAIRPSAPVIPLNLLKLYVLFSARMSEGWALRAVQMSRASDGKVVEGVFLPMEPELWDPRRMRLTMLLDPGRIKRGLVPHEEAGYPLREGEAVVVRVDAGWRDADGAPLRSGAERRYEVGPAVRKQVDPAAWQIAEPRAGSNAPLEVSFDRPLDSALLRHCLNVERVAGTVFVAEGECSWSFVPLAPWQAGEHLLTVDSRLEDLAGNSLARVFDRDLTHPHDDPRPGGTASVPFDVR